MSTGSDVHPPAGPDPDPDRRPGQDVDPRHWFRTVTARADRPVRSRSSISLERRWFGRGDPPDDVAAFLSDAEPEQRTDRYAPIDRDDVGLKVRNGRRIGLKRRRCRIELGDGLAAAERWTRCSGRIRTEVSLEGWTALHKRRVRHLVDLSGSDPQRTEGRRRPARGGAVELVLVQRDLGELWWSVAVETWGREDRADLLRMCRWLPVDWGRVERRADVAGAYPAWLRSAGP